MPEKLQKFWIYFRAKATDGSVVKLKLYNTTCYQDGYPARWYVEPKAKAKVAEGISKGEITQGAQLIKSSIIWAYSEEELDTNPTKLGHRWRRPQQVSNDGKPPWWTYDN